MNARRIAIAAGIVGGLGWTAKIVVMALQGGPDSESVPEAVAFFAGLLGVTVAAGATGAHVAREAPRWRRALAAVGSVLAALLVVGLGQWALTRLPGEGWLQEEAIFGAVGLVALVAALLALRQGSKPARAAS